MLGNAQTGALKACQYQCRSEDRAKRMGAGVGGGCGTPIGESVGWKYRWKYTPWKSTSASLAFSSTSVGKAAGPAPK